MKKLCMIGNSHVAAMRLALQDALNAYPSLDVEVYGAHATNLVTARVHAGEELTFDKPLWVFAAGEEASRARSVPLRGFDDYVIVGCDFGPSCIFQTYKRYYFSGLKGKRRQAITRQQFMQAASRLAADSAALILARSIREAGGNVLLVPTPLPAEKGLHDTEKAKMEPFRAAQDEGDGATLMQLYEELCSQQEQSGFRVIRQPEETKASEITSLQVFSDNSIRLRPGQDEIHPENDYFHMNSLYGSLIWKQIADLCLPAHRDEVVQGAGHSNLS
jgi:hypothetical protein